MQAPSMVAKVALLLGPTNVHFLAKEPVILLVHRKWYRLCVNVITVYSGSIRIKSVGKKTTRHTGDLHSDALLVNFS